jgi:DNA-binding transcriptional LysR family regulator
VTVLSINKIKGVFSVETRVLKYFLTIAQTNNITKSAVELHVTQPTLSRQIMELEKELGVKLFVRRPRLMSLTAEGALFQQRAQVLLRLWKMWSIKRRALGGPFG